MDGQATRGRRWTAGKVKVGLLGLGLLGLPGCDDGKVKACHAKMEKSQASLLAMNNQEAADVEGALGDIEAALAACRAAERTDEVKDVLSAKRTVTAHLTALKERASAPPRPTLTPAEVAALEKNGDPDCPRGQGYTHGASKNVIKCTGRPIALMAWDKALGHFQKRGYTLAESAGDPPRLLAEHGAERFVLSYAVGKKDVPKCVEATGRPGVPWQELAARLSAVHPDKLELGKPVLIDGVSALLQVGGTPAQWTVALGECPTPAQPLAVAPAEATQAPAPGAKAAPPAPAPAPAPTP